MGEKYGIQGDESEVDVRNFKVTRTLVTIEIVKNNLDEDVSMNNNSDDKNDEEKFSQINNKVIVSQKLEYGGEKRGVIKVETVILEQTQDITDNTQSES
jgi:hypothetical protein